MVKWSEKGLSYGYCFQDLRTNSRHLRNGARYRLFSGEKEKRHTFYAAFRLGSLDDPLFPARQIYGRRSELRRRSEKFGVYAKRAFSVGAFRRRSYRNRRGFCSLRNFYVGRNNEPFPDSRDGSVVGLSLHNRRKEDKDNLSFRFSALAYLRRVVFFGRRRHCGKFYDNFDTSCALALQKIKTNAADISAAFPVSTESFSDGGSKVGTVAFNGSLFFRPPILRVRKQSFVFLDRMIAVFAVSDTRKFMENSYFDVLSNFIQVDVLI